MGGSSQRTPGTAIVPNVYFDERIAERYEAYWPNLFEPAVVDPVVSFLADLAGDGGTLELGIGTGRIALPLSRRDDRRLLHHQGGRDVPAYLVRNTIENLTSQDEQAECFRNVAAQGLVSHHYWVIDGQLEIFSAPFCYVWPAELDLMARLAGMTLRERWSNWAREPFTSDSTAHISVWEKTA